MPRFEQRTAASPEVLIREAEATDVPALLTFMEKTGAETDFLSFGPGESPIGREDEADFLESCRESPNEVYLTAWIGKELVGTLNFWGGLYHRNRHSGEFGMTVRKQYWGQGIGSLLLDSLIAWARGSGLVTKINLQVRVDNLRAIELYERKGFEREGRIINAVLLGRTYHDSLCLGLAL